MSESLHGPRRNRAGQTEKPLQNHLAEDSYEEDPARELAEDFADWYCTAAPEDFDEETLDVFLEELDKQAPLELSFDPQAALERFHSKVSSLSKAGSEAPARRARPRFRRLAAIAATAAVLLGSMMTVQALGVDVFGFFANWTNDIFFFSSNQQSKTYPLALGESAEFESVEAALEAFGVEASVVPGWYPDDIGEFTVTGSVFDSGMDIYAVSDGGERLLTINYAEFDEDAGPLRFIEKDASGVLLYEKGGYAHYIMEDHGLYTTTWIADNMQCVIAGFISRDEMIQVIDSIYEVV